MPFDIVDTLERTFIIQPSLPLVKYRIFRGCSHISSAGKGGSGAMVRQLMTIADRGRGGGYRRLEELPRILAVEGLP